MTSSPLINRDGAGVSPAASSDAHHGEKLCESKTCGEVSQRFVNLRTKPHGKLSFY